MADVPKTVVELVERFARNLDAYRHPDYKEARVRAEFIDPFFEALGWDVYNRAGDAEAYKDVILEDAIKIGAATRAPDYCFRIGGARKFFVEAKRPSVSIKGDVSPSYQLRRYAWSAKLPIAVLTDFEEFAVYDCRRLPKAADKVSADRINYLVYTDYVAKWDEIAAVFSKQAVRQGSFDRFVESDRRKRGTSEVDAEFLKEIEEWRLLLARNLALRNPGLSVRDLNFAVQRTIDRLLFLRICEDRGVELYGALQALLNGENIYRRLLVLFRNADDKYNSGIFHFQEEKGRATPPDNLTPELAIDDKPLKDILRRLYYPDSPYEFSVLPADILGNVYEQFLGKVIRLTAGHQAKVEEKPEVKKAGGVYYTPRYIVDYIVAHTVGDLCRDKTPKQISALRILDPACGSGSFLIGAYQYLLDYHRDWYVANLLPERDASGSVPQAVIGNKVPSPPDKKSGQTTAMPIFQGRGGQWSLTTSEKKRILLNNIYGVDIDGQAVEVTKLNLLLKVLEGENEQTIGAQLRFLHERALPDLGDNIKCGNSLIGPDFYDRVQLTLFDEDERYRINAFDWQREFPAIMQNGGFDAVIGNPPYGATFEGEEGAYFAARYRVFRAVKDVYTCFVERASTVLKNGGLLSYIIPSSWIGGPDYRGFRAFMAESEIDTLLLLPFDIFADAYVDTAIVVLRKQPVSSDHNVTTYTFPKRAKLTAIDVAADQFHRVAQSDWLGNTGQKFILDSGAQRIAKTLAATCQRTLADVAEMKRGVLFDKGLLTCKRASSLSHPFFEGHVYRYQLDYQSQHWVEFSDAMRERPKDFLWFEGNRILMRRLVNRRHRLMAALATETFITNKNLYSIRVRPNTVDERTLLAILNSALISYLYVRQVTQAVKDDFPQVTIKDVLALPFPAREALDGTAAGLRTLADTMLTLNISVASAKTPDAKTQLSRQIETTDRQIDRLVYELYGLTEEEIGIVEGVAD